MLGRKTYTPEEIAAARAAVGRQLAAYDALAGAGSDRAAEATYFAATLMALDRTFVHRVRTVTGKDTNPLSEVELLVDALMLDGGVLPPTTVVRYAPEESVLGLKVGDTVALTRDDFEWLATAFLDTIEARCL